ncbi:molybdopterin molybdenumtransferase MoeA [ANME-1 cluster archaeon GoMg4]|nr:molybdopterin molybdenumtransferase MoeA [ANME-1 cluster archaeon GoMg4]
MKLFRTLIPLDEALKTVLSYAKRTEIEEIRFEDVLNRVLAEDVVSPIDSPPFDRAAMDGYAIRGEDSFGAAPRNPVFLKINRRVEEKENLIEIGAGECVPIATGMPVPKGSNAVVMLEYTKERGDTLEIFKPVTPGKNVSFRGEDVKKGEAVLKAGKMLQAHDIGMLASLFKITVKVYKRAKIGIISTGDELIDPTVQLPEQKQEQRQRKIADANSYVLAALTQKIAVSYRMGIVRDNYEDIKNALRSPLEGDCDALLVSGGSSVGNRDFLADAVEDLGKLIFHGVAIRPGEPVGFGVINSKPVFVLPGYPVATISAFELLVRPFLYAMHGVPVKEERRKIFAVASKKIPSAVGRTDFVRVKLFRTEGGYHVEPLRVSGSGILSSMTKSDGFVVIAENKEGVAEGEQVAVTEYFAL